MNLKKLKEAEAAVLDRYPGGFNNQEIIAIRTKRHNVDTLIAFAQESFIRDNFRFPALIVQSLVKLIGRSSIISRYEKPRFRDFVQSLPAQEQNLLTRSLEEYLHGEEEQGFEAILELLGRGQLAKWPLMTACPAYVYPQRDVLIKPTTVKTIIAYFEVGSLEYRPRPTWDFYQAYRSTIQEMKSYVDASLAPSNIAFSWFLLLSSHRDLF